MQFKSNADFDHRVCDGNEVMKYDMYCTVYNIGLTWKAAKPKHVSTSCVHAALTQHPLLQDRSQINALFYL